jgi:hypothetical protein
MARDETSGTLERIVFRQNPIPLEVRERKAKENSTQCVCQRSSNGKGDLESFPIVHLCRFFSLDLSVLLSPLEFTLLVHSQVLANESYLFKTN